MGYLGLGLAGLLFFAVPASIARASLVGAYVVIAVIAAAAVALVVRAAQRRQLSGRAGKPLRNRLILIAVLTAVYAALATIIHVS